MSRSSIITPSLNLIPSSSFLHTSTRCSIIHFHLLFLLPPTPYTHLLFLVSISSLLLSLLHPHILLLLLLFQWMKTSSAYKFSWQPLSFVHSIVFCHNDGRRRESSYLVQVPIKLWHSGPKQLKIQMLWAKQRHLTRKEVWALFASCQWGQWSRRLFPFWMHVTLWLPSFSKSITHSLHNIARIT